MTTLDKDHDLSARARGILLHHAGWMDSVHMARILSVDSASAYRAMMAIPGVETLKGTRLTQFKVAQ